MYRIFDIGTVAIFLEEGTGGRIIGLTLPAGEKFPEEFKVGDAVELTNHPSDPAQVAMGHITGFYEITHIATGKTFKTWHKTTFTRFRAIDACLLVRNAETLVASKGSVRDRAESLGLVHVRVRPKDEDCDEKRSATRSCNGSAFSIYSWAQWCVRREGSKQIHTSPWYIDARISVELEEPTEPGESGCGRDDEIAVEQRISGC